MECGEHFIGASDHFAEVCRLPKGHTGWHSSKVEERQPNTELRDIAMEIIDVCEGQRTVGHLKSAERILAAFAASIQEEARQQIASLNAEVEEFRVDCIKLNKQLAEARAQVEELKEQRDMEAKSAIAYHAKVVELKAQLAEARAQLGAAVAVLKGYEEWEANLLMCHESWGENDTPRITQELWDELLALQTKRNNVAAALERAAGEKK